MGRDRPGIDFALRGVDIVCNSSASHSAFDKFAVRQRFVVEGCAASASPILYATIGDEAAPRDVTTAVA